MKPTFAYAWLTAKHRWFVLIAGLKLGVPLRRLLLHDLSKFGPSELRHYGRQFFGDRADPLGFSYAWLHHQRINKHHWEAWIPVTGHNRGGYADMEPLPMPKAYALEMVADWLGASRAYEGKWPQGSWPWLEENFSKIKLHPQTRVFVLLVISRFVDQRTEAQQ
jgi:hypothetical protein